MHSWPLHLLFPVNHSLLQWLTCACNFYGVFSHDRPEVLYGRPALAALRVQRDALRELYYTYDSIEKTHDTGSSGINRSLFLKVSVGIIITKRCDGVSLDFVRQEITIGI